MFKHKLLFMYKQKKGDDKLSPRTGRPTDNPKGNYTGVRLSDDEIKKIDFCMKKTGMSKTDVIRKGIDLVYNELNKK